MLSIKTAQALRQAGLVWEVLEHDFFSVPDRGMDERVFVISEMPAHVAQLQGEPVMMFEGAVEWALDYVPAGEVVWRPTEEQLRGLLATELAVEPLYNLALHTTADGCRCEMVFAGQSLTFPAAEAAEAYAAALLHVLQSGAAR